MAGRTFLDTQRSETEPDWTFVSPSALFEPGERTGTFRVGADRLLGNGSGVRRVTMGDYAIVQGDETESPEHSSACPPSVSKRGGRSFGRSARG